MKKNLQQTILVLTLIFGFTDAYSQAHNSPGCVSSAQNNTSALGYNTQGLGINSFAAGKESIAEGLNSFAVGFATKANGVNSIAIGESCYSGSQSFAIGQNAKAKSDNSFAFGRYVETDALGAGAIVIGATNTASGILTNKISNSLMIGFSSTPIFFANNTKIGIATTNPLYTLDVNGTSLFRDEVRMATLMSPCGKRVVITDEEGRLSFTEDFIEIPGDNLGNHIATMNIQLGNWGLSYISEKGVGLTLNDQNEVKIWSNLETPAIIGNSKQDLILTGSTFANSSSIYVGRGQDPGNEYLKFYTSGTNCHHQFNINGESRLLIKNNEMVIGSPTLSSDLKVNGKVYSKEVMISLADYSLWPDYVFNHGYILSSLKEVENYIQSNGHLPDIPSKEEVSTNGINLAVMDAKLLEKIEQLTLYLIELEKVVEQQQNEIQSLKNK